jgi:alpha-beta hydrolase superfamily lysophospholipase
MEPDIAGQEPWFKYFPQHHMWSQALLGSVEMAPWGMATIGEIDQIGKRLQKAIGDNEAWHREWTWMAQRVEALADEAAAKNRDLTAGGAYLRASIYYFAGERFIPPKDPRKAAGFEKVLSCFQRGIRRVYPQVEQASVPYEGTVLPAYYYPADPRIAKKHPTVVFTGGLDSTKEMLLCGAVELNRRGLSCLTVDGPGQGEALRVQKIPSRYDYEVPMGACVDYLETRLDVDPKRIGIMAWSMGGYYAPRAAAFEKRFKACVAWGAHFDYHEVWVQRRKVLESRGTEASAPVFQLPYVLGVENMDQAMEKIKAFTLEGAAQKIKCPILITHGERDTIVPVEMAHRLYEKVGSKKKELKIFSTEEGGCQHINFDNRTLGVTYVADWLMEVL